MTTPKKNADDHDGAEVEDAQGQPARAVPALRRRAAAAGQADDATSCTCCCRTTRGATCRPERRIPDKLLGGRKGGWANQAWPMAVNRQAQLLQLAYTDRLLGEVIDRLEKQGIWDDALVVVTADHGEGFIPGGAGRQLTDEPESQAQVAWVPMFLKEPGQSKGTHQRRELGARGPAARRWPTRSAGSCRSRSTASRSCPARGSAAEKYLVQLARPAHRLPGVAGLPARQGRRHGHLRGRLGRPGRAVHDGQPAGLDRQDRVGPDLARGRCGRCAEPDDRPPLRRSRLRRGRPGERQRAVAGDRHAAALGRAAARSSSPSTAPWAPCRRSIPEAKKPSFAGLVNDALFRPGDNDLALYEVVGDTTPQLRPIRLR